MSRILKVVGSVAFCELVGIAGAFFTTPAIPVWFASLNKPFFSPPNFLFAPVWTILYFMMGISLYLIWETKKSKGKENALKFFLAQLFLNFLWSIAFFGLRSPLFGVIIIIPLWILIILTIINFQKINKAAGYILYPYLAWVSFAALLNISLWILNF